MTKQVLGITSSAGSELGFVFANEREDIENTNVLYAISKLPNEDFAEKYAFRYIIGNGLAQTPLTLVKDGIYLAEIPEKGRFYFKVVMIPPNWNKYQGRKKWDKQRQFYLLECLNFPQLEMASRFYGLTFVGSVLD